MRSEPFESKSEEGVPKDIINAELIPGARTKNEVEKIFQPLAENAQLGLFPPYLYEKGQYLWAVGGNGSLLSEDGRVAWKRESPSIQPFLLGDSLITWADVELTQKREDEYLPIPSAVWKTRDGMELTITLYVADGIPYFRYRVQNKSGVPKDTRLILAFRPLEVPPPWQHSDTSPIESLEQRGDTVVLNGDTHIQSSIRPHGWSAKPFGGGNIMEDFKDGVTPKQDQVRMEDSIELASGALWYDISLLEDGAWEVSLRMGAEVGAAWTPQEAVAEHWRQKLARMEGIIPDPEFRKIAQSVVADALVSRDGIVIQPGTTFYKRSWARDGAAIAALLLKMGFREEAEDYIRFYARHQGSDGNVPAILDKGFPDWVPDWNTPENDSQGQLPYMIMEYVRANPHDREFLNDMWPHVRKAIDYIETLMEKDGPYQGLMKASKSHEGYGEKLVHAFWDNFSALRAIRDAAEMAGKLENWGERDRLTNLGESFTETLYGSISRVMEEKGIDYIPGAPEIGDFDLPSIAEGARNLPDFLETFRTKLDSMATTHLKKVEQRKTNENGKGYTPYEFRIVGLLIRLGRMEEAIVLFRHFLAVARRPLGWNGVPEIVWPDARQPGYIGDVPHIWGGAEMVFAILALLGLL